MAHIKFIILLLFMVTGPAPLKPEAASVTSSGPAKTHSGPTSQITRLYPLSSGDYGYGPSIRVDLYSPVGPEGTGAFIGHPNGQPLRDRVLVRFNVSRYLLRPIDEVYVERAVLHFALDGFCGKEDVRTLEVSHLKYDALILSGNDLVNDETEVVGTVSVRRSTATATAFSVNILSFLRKDIRQGNKYCAFRFRDVTAETKGNPDLAPAGVTISCLQKTPFSLETEGQNEY